MLLSPHSIVPLKPNATFPQRASFHLSQMLLFPQKVSFRLSQICFVFYNKINIWCFFINHKQHTHVEVLKFSNFQKKTRCFKFYFCVYMCCCSKHFKQTTNSKTHMINFQHFNIYFILFKKMHDPTSMLEYQKHNVATKLISYKRYGEILFQTVASGYLLHFAQDGSSKNALEKQFFCNTVKNRKLGKIV